MNDTAKSLESIVPDLRKILGDVRKMVDRCERRLFKPMEFMDAMKQTLDRVTDLVPGDSDVYRVFEREWAGRSKGTSKTLDGYLNPKDCVQLHQLAAVLESMIGMLAPDFLISGAKDEYYSAAGDEFAPKLRIWELVRTAKKSVVIVDDYLDDSIFPYVESLPESINVRLLTGKKKPIFRSLLEVLKKRQTNVDARVNVKCHDRFIVVDGTDVWHVGASINRLGVKAVRISKIVDDGDRAQFLSDCKGWWDNGDSL